MRPSGAGTLTSKPISPVKLTRNSRAGDAGHRALHAGHMREGLFRQFDAFHQRREQLCRVRAVQRNGGPLFGRRGQPDIEIRPLRLEVILHHVQHPGGAACRGGDVETVFGHAADDTIVANEAVIAEQQAITAAAAWRASSRDWYTCGS